MNNSTRHPEWWHKAAALELDNRLEEAEKTISDAVPDQHFAIAIAGLYRTRLQRLRAQGDLEGARHARAKAVDWAYFLASQATSGCEGLALSAERDEFLATLGPEF